MTLPIDDQDQVERGLENALVDGASGLALAGTAGMTLEERERAQRGELRYTEVRPAAYNARARLADMDTDGISSAIVYPTMLLGIAGVLFALLSPLYGPLIVIWALCYYGLTFGSAASATIGMRVMDLEMRTWYGAPAYFVLGAVHAIVFWITIWFPPVLLVGLLNERHRLLHDILLGTVVINNPARAQMLRDMGRSLGRG